ncbi:MAG: response regulator, partial [Elusimicrobia bacterium]|nr:response regulator [Elusimicrobiota bacterium]
AIARATLETSADGILVVDPNLRVILCNHRHIEMWSMTEEVARSGDVRRMAEFVKDQTEDPEAFMRLALTVPEAGDDSERRDSIRLKDGRVFDRISRPHRIGGKVVGRTIMTRDITLHIEGMRALARARDEALEAARLKSRFVADVSHELRTPLNAVVGAAELLADAPLPAKYRESLVTLRRGARVLLDVVDEVLDFSKLEAVRMTIERAPLSPGAALADAAALVAPRAAEKGLALRLDPGEAAELALLGDSKRLRQVLLNLLSNAVKFTERGEISAEIRIVSSAESSVELEFSVSDTGIGVSPEQAGRIFSPFSQGGPAMTRLYGGTGLGLAISKSLVELMGGTLDFESRPGQGARFFLRLRLERDRSGASDVLHAPRPVPAPAIATVRRDRLRVLIVEDVELNRSLLQRQLEHLGLPASTAAGGRPALELLRQDEFGLILMDIQMPGMDGCQAAAEIRRLEAGRRRTPIVAISANTSEEDRRRCLDAEMDDFLSKPLTLGDLAAAVERWDRPFDETALAAFAAVAADAPGELARLLGVFVADARLRLTDARAAAAHGDRKSCARAAHALKGAAAAVGARGLRELARRVEESSGEPTDGGGLALLLDQADAELLRLSADVARRFRA